MTNTKKTTKQNSVVTLDLQNVCCGSLAPSSEQFKQWVQETLIHYRKKSEITIRIVDEQESAYLNETYRHKQGPTNVLSFPFTPPPHIRSNLLGDLVICAPLVAREAQQQKKAIQAHWAHLTIHGILHLLGYDHETDPEATVMEGIEIEILNRLGFANPYPK